MLRDNVIADNYGNALVADILADGIARHILGAEHKVAGIVSGGDLIGNSVASLLALYLLRLAAEYSIALDDLKSLELGAFTVAVVNVVYGHGHNYRVLVVNTVSLGVVGGGELHLFNNRRKLVDQNGTDLVSAPVVGVVLQGYFLNPVIAYGKLVGRAALSCRLMLFAIDICKLYT